MAIDFENALSYIGNDKKWGSKLLIGSCMLFGAIAILVIPFLIAILTSSVVGTIISLAITFVISILLCLSLSGYVMVAGNQRINNPENEQLPEWSDFWCHVSVGLKYFVGYFLFFIPVVLSSLIFFAIFGAFTMSTASDKGASAAVLFIFIILFGALALFIYLLTMIFLPLMMANFTKDLRISSFVDFKNGFAMLKDNIGNYLLLILLFIAVSILGQLICSVLCATIIGIVFLPVISFYIYFVIVDLLAQFVHTSQEEK